jgi:tRNA (adenine22-N1)-methyltransferase
MRTTAPILTPRLQQIADRIQPCACVADIGTDHAYLPVFLCMTQKAEKAIASDIRKGPLARAEATILRYGMQNRVETRLGGGADTLQVGEADCIVIAGMGGLMIAEILKENPAIVMSYGNSVHVLVGNYYEVVNGPIDMEWIRNYHEKYNAFYE